MIQELLAEAEATPRLRADSTEETGFGKRGTPKDWQLLGAGLALVLLWGLVLVALTGVFDWGWWLPQALSIAAATVLIGCAVRIGIGRIGAAQNGAAQNSAARTGTARIGTARARLLAVACGAVTGAACFAAWLGMGGRGGEWLRDPAEMADEVYVRLLQGTAPLTVAGALEDALLFIVLILAVATMALLVGSGRPVLAGSTAAFFLLVPSAVTGFGVDWPLLLCAGVLIAGLVWIGSPAPNRSGIVAAGLALALAAGAMATAPTTRDRVWNDALFPAPVSDTVPDVTLALAQDLRERGDASAFSFTSTVPGAYRFTLATLSDFSDGVWYPQDEVVNTGVTVSDARTPTSLSPQPFDGQLPASTAAVTVTVDGLLSGWLPLPGNTVRVLRGEQPDGFDPDEWLWISASNTARANGNITRRNNQYVAVVVDPGDALPEDPATQALFPDPEQAPGALADYLELPEGVPGLIAETAAGVAGGAGDRLAVAEALQSWFRGGDFAYDEEAPYQPGTDPENPYEVMVGLLTERTGFCVHYASTFAVMARHLGVPSRVNIGYAAQIDEDSETVVLGRDLHAWPEVYIDEVGWIPFEPTPGGAGVRADDAEATQEAPDETDTDESDVERPAPEVPQQQEQPEDVDTGASDESGEDGNDSNAGRVELAIALLTLAAALLLAPTAVRRYRSARRSSAIARGEQAAERAWEELFDTAVDLGLLADGDDPPRARTAEALIEHLVARKALNAEGAEAAQGISAAMASERYGAATSEPNPGIAAQLRLVKSELRSAAGGSARLRAAWLPRSVLPKVVLPRIRSTR